MIKCFDGFHQETFRDACFAKGFLEHDREYNDAIEDTNYWGSRYFLRKLFVSMLLAMSIDQEIYGPKHNIC